MHAHIKSGRRHVLFSLADRIGSKVENRGGENGGGVAIANALDQVIERADAARSDHRDPHRIGKARVSGISNRPWCRPDPST
jgi:hypothetical protein